MSDFTLTDGQKLAIEKAAELQTWSGAPRVGVIRGFAGVGKSFVLGQVIKNLGKSIVVTPTGKAANRIKELTGYGASTVHRYLFKCETNPKTGELQFSRKPLEEIERSDSGILLIDEGSMINEELWGEIVDICMVLEQNIIVFGDHAQLSPVSKDGTKSSFNLLADTFACRYANWVVTLTEIHRQALDSPIIRASMLIRTGDVLEGLLSLPRIIDDELVSKGVEVLADGGVILCHKNTTRHKYNNAIRQQKYGDNAELQVDEPLLVLKNSYAAMRFNGEVFNFRGWIDKLNAELPIHDPYSRQTVHSGFGVTDVGELLPLHAVLATKAIGGELEGIGINAIEKASKRLYLKEPYVHVNYGYVLSTWKAQGSSWPSVVAVIEKSIWLNTDEGRRYAYTSITRAEKDVSICFLP